MSATEVDPAFILRKLWRAGADDLNRVENTLGRGAATNLTTTVGKAKSFNIAETISGGVPPYSLSFSGTEPTGFSYSAGVLSGTATEANTYNCAITVTDSIGTIPKSPRAATRLIAAQRMAW